MTETLKLSAIRADQRAQPRAELHMEKIGEYVEDMQRGDTFPALVVFHDGATYWLADGFHRYYAATSAECDSFACEVFEGGLRDAILYSCGANAAHGLRRTNRDKQRAVAKLLEDPEWSKWTDYEIARRCAVSSHFVGKIRKEVQILTMNIHSEERQYRTKHGTVSTMNTARIGARPQAVDEPKPALSIPSADIASHLREIRRHIDALPSAADTVARFPEDQWLSMPLSELESMALWMNEVAQHWRERIKAKTKCRSVAFAPSQ